MRMLFGILVFLSSLGTHAQPSSAQLSVWANEAIVATYTYDYQNYLVEQRQIAHYFTSSGWMIYSENLAKVGLPTLVKEKQFYVSAVATSPPRVSPLGADAWRVEMPLLVVYKNPQQEQKQTLLVTIFVKKVGADQGVRGLVIERLQSVEQKPSCACDL